jgi:hypothetical protein
MKNDRYLCSRTTPCGPYEAVQVSNLDALRRVITEHVRRENTFRITCDYDTPDFRPLYTVSPTGNRREKEPFEIFPGRIVHDTGRWTVTDPDAGQKMRKVRYCDAHTEYEFSQMTGEGLVEDSIDLEEYIHEDGFEGTYLAPFGCKDLDEAVATYGDDWETVVAEWIFETDLINP